MLLFPGGIYIFRGIRQIRDTQLRPFKEGLEHRPFSDEEIKEVGSRGSVKNPTNPGRWLWKRTFLGKKHNFSEKDGGKTAFMLVAYVYLQHTLSSTHFPNFWMTFQAEEVAFLLLLLRNLDR